MQPSQAYYGTSVTTTSPTATRKYLWPDCERTRLRHSCLHFWACLNNSIIVVQIGHTFNPKPHYNSSYLNGKNPEPLRYTNAAQTIIAQANANAAQANRADGGASQFSGSAMGRAGAAIMGNASQTLTVKSPMNGLLPNSFKTALEEIEDEIIQL